MLRGKLFNLVLGFSIVVLGNCKNKGSDLFYTSNPSDTEWIQLEYGSELGEHGRGNLLPVFRVRDALPCLESRDLDVRDFGPRLRFCLEDTKENQKIWEEVANAFISPSQAKSFPEYLILSNDFEIRIDFPSESSVAKNWKLNPPSHWILLDDSLREKFSETKMVWLDGQESALAKSYSLPYWNYVEENSCYFLLRSFDLDVAKSSRKFLRITIPCDVISAKIRLFIQESKVVHLKMKSKCLHEPIRIQEIFQHTSSKMNRFMEWKNPLNEAVCLDSISFANSEIPFYSNESLGFLFPHSHLVFLHEESDLEGRVLPFNFPWDQALNSDTKFQLRANGAIQEIQSSIDSTLANYKEEDEYFSKDLDNSPCGIQKILYTTKEKICATPGWSARVIENSPNFCKPEDIQLTEIQANGILDTQSNSFSQDRFLEFQIHHKDENFYCDISSLFLRIGTDSFPLSSQERVLKQGNIFLISLSNKFPTLNIISRNLSRLNWQSQIVMQDIRKIESDRVFRSGQEARYVDSDAEGNLYSLELQHDSIGQEIYLHHRLPRLPSASISTEVNYIQASKEASFSLPIKQISSPGRVYQSQNLQNLNISLESDGYSELTEILWSGSFLNSTSVLDDRFVEWQTLVAKSSSLLLVIEFPGFFSRNQSYLLPNQAGVHSLSKKEFQCFYNKSNLFHKDFTLYHSNTWLTLIDPITNKVLDNAYIASSELGENSNASRIRRSAVKNLASGTWFTSTILSPHCIGQTFASPGEIP